MSADLEKKEGNDNKESEIPEEVLNSKTGPYKLKQRKINEKNFFKIQSMPSFEEDIDYLFWDIKNYSLLVNKIDTCGNSIPIGSFCFAIAFVLLGFKECKVNSSADDFFKFILLIFGGLGQLIAGILEYIKGRTFPSNLYLIYGTYFISYYYLCYDEDFENKKELRAFYYGSWGVLSLPFFVGSVKTNIFYLVQTGVTLAFFIIRCIGEYKHIEKMNEYASGVLELVTGFVSLYICINQIINENFKFNAIPSIPLSEDNEIDIIIKERENEKENEKEKEKEREKEKEKEK